MAAAAAVEHEALLNAQSDLKAIQTELEKLNSEHAQALQEAQDRIESLEAEASRAADLESSLEHLKKENEEQASKVSELEIEILETKEEHDSTNDEMAKILARVKLLEEDLEKANTSLTAAAEAAQAKEAEFADTSAATAEAHSEALAKAADEASKLLEQLKDTEAQLASAIAANQQAKSDFETATHDLLSKLEEAENLHNTKQAELSEEVQRITSDLEVRSSRLPPDAITDILFRARRLSTTPRLMRLRQSTSSFFRKPLSAPRCGFPSSGCCISLTKVTHRTKLVPFTAKSFNPSALNPTPQRSKFALASSHN